MNVAPQLSKDQIKHILKLTELSLRYVGDCDGDCDACLLGIAPMTHSGDLPELPPGLKICELFDYISQTMEINEASNAQ